jgi:hypothetical protein
MKTKLWLLVFVSPLVFAQETISLDVPQAEPNANELKRYEITLSRSYALYSVTESGVSKQTVWGEGFAVQSGYRLNPLVTFDASFYAQTTQNYLEEAKHYYDGAVGTTLTPVRLSGLANSSLELGFNGGFLSTQRIRTELSETNNVRNLGEMRVYYPYLGGKLAINATAALGVVFDFRQALDEFGNSKFVQLGMRYRF